MWWYEGLGFLNDAGTTNSDHHGIKLDVGFGDFLRSYCLQHGVEFVRPHVFQGDILGPLRDTLRRLKVQVWSELTFGFSYDG